ncbi:Protein-arginine deiminase type-3 [Paramyrothecium foliicola]|nr:Protein-arginine deiminase type-3 [Paramyrothecium foliicola]
MLLLNGKVAVLALASCHLSYALTATILADTNRDGKVDVTGTSDVAGKKTWTNARGALFLPNIGDTDGRCSQLPDFTEDNLHYCNDATDNVLRQAKYLAPIRTLPVTDVSANGVGRVKVTNAAAVDRVRIFHKQGSQWNYVDQNYQFTAAQLRAGLELGIDGRDVRRPNIWDGKATVQFTVTDGSATSTDTVELRVAPFLTHDPTQLAQRVFAAKPGTWDLTAKFNAELSSHNTAVGIQQPVTFIGGFDRWVQDQFETGYASIPGPTGAIVIRILLLSHQRRNGSHASLYAMVRSGDVAGVGFPEVYSSDTTKWGGTYDSTGNLETIPPHTFNGKTYPAGRIIIGEGETSPLILPFLQAQEVQSPIVLDTNWLQVGHVDEFVHFLPANNARGWVVVADDPLAGLALLRNASAAGHGGQKASSRPLLPSDTQSGACVPKSTINWEINNRPNLVQANEYAAERIQYNLNIIKRETGVTDAEIIRVPGLFWTTRWGCNEGAARLATSQSSNEDEILDIVKAAGGDPSTLKRRQTSSVGQLRAHYPSAVNGVVLSNSYYLAPNPWGPVINGKDIFAEAINAAYAKVGYTVHYIDTWFSHHQGGGEVHCGTNVWRETDAIWW